jgi:hypothetical protein
MFFLIEFFFLHSYHLVHPAAIRDMPICLFLNSLGDVFGDCYKYSIEN